MQNHLSSEYVSTEFAKILQHHELTSFEQLWAYKGEWFEQPNKKRGGWSGVNYLELTNHSGQKQGFYLKRQEGYTRKTWRHPIKGEPTFEREYKILNYLKRKKVPTPQMAYFGKSGTRAILMTAALDGYISADQWLSGHQGELKTHFISALGKAVRAMHQAKVQHRSLYFKHLFVKPNAGEFDVAIIDFEKSRITHMINVGAYADLNRLWQRSQHFTLDDKKHFFKSYLAVKDLNFLNQKIFAWLTGQY